jgi:hypothetical protein
MPRLDLDEMGWKPVAVELVRGEAACCVRLGETTIDMQWPRIVVADPESQTHISGWQVSPGGTLDEPSESEQGLRAGYHHVGFDDGRWYSCSRVNEVSFGFPTWEGHGYAGYLWYRARAARPAGGEEIALTLGSPLEQRRLAWQIFVNGIAVLAEPLTAGMVTVPIPASPESDPDQELLIAVQVRVEPQLDPERIRELESWRTVDLFCHQTLHVVDAFTTLDATASRLHGNILELTYAQNLKAVASFETIDELVRQRVHLLGDGAGTPWVSHVILTELHADEPAYHAEGAWAVWGPTFQAAIHPAAATLSGTSGPCSVVWPGRHLGQDERLSLPDVVIGVGPTERGDHNVREFLGRMGRSRTPYRIYDPYGWYQISHVHEPKVELTDALLSDIDEVLERLVTRGAEFDALALDCGWNDPDDLSRFHPDNFPDGSKGLQTLLEQHSLDLILWVSPSDGARAFRHERGLADPRLDGCRSGNGALPWRLCPAAKPWRDEFRAALLHHVSVNDATGFKVDGVDLWCSSTAHGHAAGIYALFATSSALTDTFQAVIGAGARLLMLYWGLRSPWWLRYGATLWERDYLVEGAAPSGGSSWDLRLGVASSQDIGQQSSWPSVPAHQQDSLGVWISNTIWASRQGAALWDDALVLDIARGSLLYQLWGDLRMIEDERQTTRLRQILELGRRRQPELMGQGTPIADPAWVGDVYGYSWSSENGTWIVLARPGDKGTICLPIPAGRRSAQIDYVSDGAGVRVDVTDGWLTVSQSGGSVAAVFLSNEAGPTGAGNAPPLSALNWTCTELGRRLLTDSPSDVELAKVAYLGRAPQIVPWLNGETGDDLSIAQMLPRLPANDRQLEVVHLEGHAVLEARECELAVVTSALRGGAAWHHDRLHELVDVSLIVDGVAVGAERWPTFPHEQAGSWSSVVDVVALPAGRHVVEARIRVVLPTSVTASLAAWVR